MSTRGSGIEGTGRPSAAARAGRRGEPCAAPDRSPAPARSHRMRTERAFVVEFDPIAGARSPLRGRAEVVASGEVVHFRSVKQLLAFMTGTLRRHSGAGSAS